MYWEIGTFDVTMTCSVPLAILVKKGTENGAQMHDSSGDGEIFLSLSIVHNPKRHAVYIMVVVCTPQQSNETLLCIC